MSEPRPKPAAVAPPDDRFGERARALIALLGRDGVQSIAERRLPEHLARRLMHAVDATEERQQAQPAPARTEPEIPKTAPVAWPDPSAPVDEALRPGDPSAIKRLIALNARPGDLSQEHPAVLALLLADQSPALKTATLRALPGATARRVLRLMGSAAEA